jgi:hypothetical protein
MTFWSGWVARDPIDRTIQSGIGWLAHRMYVSKGDTVMLNVPALKLKLKIENISS